MALPGNDFFRAPRLLITAGGEPVRGAVSAHVTNTNYYGCDSFSATIAASADPAMGLAFWASASALEVDIAVDLGAGPASLISGRIDDVTIEPLRGTVHLSGRDRGAALVEARTQETFANRTASEIAVTLAGRRGLAARVQSTKTPVGRYWQLEHDHITLDHFSRSTTEWDLLVGLAEREGFDVWVGGDTLHFQPVATSVAPGAVLRPVATINGPANVTTLRLHRSLTLARRLTVRVKSWNSRMAQNFEQSVGAGGEPGASDGQEFHFVAPNLTPDTALLLARRKLEQLAGHERVISAEMPGELAIDAHAMLRLEGTGTAFDQDYRVDEVARGFDPRSGFRQLVRARASSGHGSVQ